MAGPSNFRATSFDVGRLLSLVDDDIELLGELFDLFREDAERHLANAEGAIQRGDRAALWQCAHALKGAVGNFAASDALQLAVRLEHGSREANLETSSRILARLGERIEELKIELRAFLAELAAGR